MKKVSKLLMGLSFLCFMSANAVVMNQVDASSTKVNASNPANNGTMDDQKLKYDISSKINGMYPENNIEVTAYHGRVLLTGQVKSVDVKAKTQQAVQSHSGVRSVSDYLTIGKKETAAKTSKDAWITTKVKSKLLTVSGVDSNELKVVTAHKVVYVLGNVTHDQATAIVNNIKTVDSVKKVVPLFDFK